MTRIDPCHPLTSQVYAASLDFRAVNVTLLETVLNSARAAGVKTFINTTTLHASRTGSLSSYAQTKQEAEDVLSRVDGIAVVNLRLPAVYGSTFAGKLAMLSKLPAFFDPLYFNVWLRLSRP